MSVLSNLKIFAASVLFPDLVVLPVCLDSEELTKLAPKNISYLLTRKMQGKQSYKNLQMTHAIAVLAVFKKEVTRRSILYLQLKCLMLKFQL